LDGKVLDKPSKKGLSLCARVKSFLFVDASSEAHPDLGLEACSDENKARLMVSLVVVPRKSKAMMTLMLFRSHFEPLNPCALDPVVAAGQRGKSYIPFSGEYNLNIDSVDQQEQEYILSSSDDSVHKQQKFYDSQVCFASSLQITQVQPPRPRPDLAR